jgi:uncharacterized membrane protein YqjE
MYEQKVDRSLGELFSELGNETSALVRQEIALAKVELTQKATKAGKNAAYLAAGAAVGYAAFLALMAALVFALGEAMPLWAAALIVGVVFAVVAGIVIYEGINNLKRMNVAPRQTVETLKEDAQWLKHQVTS